MELAQRVRVNAPGHYHDGMSGEVVSFSAGEVMHREPDGSEIVLTSERAREIFRAPDVVNDEQADVFFENYGVARYRFDQLEEVN